MPELYLLRPLDPKLPRAREPLRERACCADRRARTASTVLPTRRRRPGRGTRADAATDHEARPSASPSTAGPRPAAAVRGRRRRRGVPRVQHWPDDAAEHALLRLWRCRGVRAAEPARAAAAPVAASASVSRSRPRLAAELAHEPASAFWRGRAGSVSASRRRRRSVSGRAVSVTVFAGPRLPGPSADDAAAAPNANADVATRTNAISPDRGVALSAAAAAAVVRHGGRQRHDVPIGVGPVDPGRELRAKTAAGPPDAHADAHGDAAAAADGGRVQRLPRRAARFAAAGRVRHDVRRAPAHVPRRALRTRLALLALHVPRLQQRQRRRARTRALARKLPRQCPARHGAEQRARRD